MNKQTTCCKDMDYHINYECDKHKSAHSCPDRLFVKTNAGYGLIIHDGGTSAIQIDFCPFCGTKLS